MDSPEHLDGVSTWTITVLRYLQASSGNWQVANLSVDDMCLARFQKLCLKHRQNKSEGSGGPWFKRQQLFSLGAGMFVCLPDCFCGLLAQRNQSGSKECMSFVTFIPLYVLQHWIENSFSFSRWYAQCLQKAEKEFEVADRNYAQADEFARKMEMEEGRAVMRFW